MPKKYEFPAEIACNFTCYTILLYEHKIVFRTNMNLYMYMYRLYKIFLFSKHLFAAHIKIYIFEFFNFCQRWKFRAFIFSNFATIAFVNRTCIQEYYNFCAKKCETENVLDSRRTKCILKRCSTQRLRHSVFNKLLQEEYCIQ